MIKGTHGSTFGGNHLAIAIGKAVIGEILKKGFLEKVNVVSQILWNELQLIKKDFDEILEVRGAGLLLGIKTKSNNIEIKNSVYWRLIRKKLKINFHYYGILEVRQNVECSVCGVLYGQL